MKTPSLILPILFLATATLVAAQPFQRGRARGAGTSPGHGLGQGPGTCPLTVADSSPLVLGAEARRALLFQIDEERMAGELYAAFGAKWGLRPFAQIPLAEARHESALRQLAARAGLALPSTGAGRFDDAEVQQRYDTLLALGLESADSALRVGAYVEEVDIADLNTLIATTDSPALKDTAMGLKTASGHHLNAFVGSLQARGLTYAPQVLAVADYQALRHAAEGGRGRGRGRGQGGDCPRTQN